MIPGYLGAVDQGIKPGGVELKLRRVLVSRG